MVSVELRAAVPSDFSGRTLGGLWFPFLLLSSGHWPEGSWQPLWDHTALTLGLLTLPFMSTLLSFPLSALSLSVKPRTWEPRQAV